MWAPAGVFEVYDEVAGGLGDPGGVRVGCGAQDPDAAGCVFDGGEDVLALSGEGDGLDEVAGHEGVGLAAQG